MGDPAVKLSAVSAATKELHGVAGQALEWVRQSEARVAEAEADHEAVKVRARAPVGKRGEAGRGGGAGAPGGGGPQSCGETLGGGQEGGGGRPRGFRDPDAREQG